MTILLSGGGSGGHITPLLAVATELKRLKPDVRLVYVGQRGDKLGDIPASSSLFDETYTIRAGKFRRYHGEGLKQLIDMPTFAKNVRDAGRVVRGLADSRRLLKKIQPDVIFVKGSMLSVPIGLAAAQLGIPYVTHDSDALPGLGNRLIAKRAATHAVAQPAEVYPYPKDKTVTVGVPVAGEYERVTTKLQQEYRASLGLAAFKHVVLITGGGLGAQRLNEAAAQMVPELLADEPDTAILHLTGRDHESAMNHAYDELVPPDKRRQVIVKGYVTDLYRFSGAADVVIARAGATNMAEFALQGKACIIVPNPVLTGGHQLKNAAAWAKAEAVVVVTEEQLLQVGGSKLLKEKIEALLASPAQRQELGARLAQFAHPQAAQELARLLINIHPNKAIAHVQTPH